MSLQAYGYSCFYVAFLLLQPIGARGQQTSFHVLALYSTTVEPDHVTFSDQALKFYAAAASKDHFEFKSSTNWDDLNTATLSKYQVVLWLNDFPHTAVQRTAFEQYMEHGGAWLGFHVAAYNDQDTHWPWFVTFLGGAVFYGNNWPPLPAKLTIDDATSPVTRRLPAAYLAPANEWYIWRPDPRANKDVKVLLTLDPANYPLGFKDIIRGGDLPVVWTNTKYKMVYMNMGHGEVFASATQNLLFEDAMLWLGRQP
jgi:hypothetical protein